MSIYDILDVSVLKLQYESISLLSGPNNINRENQMNKFYNEAQAGANKTQFNIETAISQVIDGKNVIFVTSGKEVSTEISNRIQQEWNSLEMNMDWILEDCPNVIINSSTTEQITADVNGLLTNTQSHIIILCHQFFVLYDWLSVNRSNIVFILDEAFSIYDSYKFKITDTKPIFAQNCVFTPISKSIYQLTKKHSDFCTTDYFMNTHPLIKKINNTQYDVFCHKNFVEYLHDDSIEAETYTFHCIFQPRFMEGAHLVLISGANIANNTEMGQLWKLKEIATLLLGTEFKPHTFSNLTIKTTKSDKWTIDIEKNNIGLKLGLFFDFNKQTTNADSLYIENSSTKVIKCDTTRTKEKTNLQGINKYRDTLTNIGIFLSANYGLPELIFLEEVYGISNTKAQELRHLDTFYQAILRSLLREGDFTTPITSWMLQQAFALALKEQYFPNATIELIGLEPTKRVRKERAKSPDALTRIEISKVARYKKKHPTECVGKTTREILNLIG